MKQSLRIRVRVKRDCTGYFGLSLREEGDIFYLRSEKEFSAEWMVKIGPKKRKPAEEEVEPEEPEEEEEEEEESEEEDESEDESKSEEEPESEPSPEDTGKKSGESTGDKEVIS